MSSAITDARCDWFQLSLPQDCGQYEPSIASSALSSQDSVFSDASSTQSSVASSISDDFRLSQEEARDRCSQQYRQQQANAGHVIAQEQAKVHALLQQQCANGTPSYADVTSVPSEQRQHPRRSSLARNQKPPPLVRQCERRVSFVDNLVDSATQMVEVIWPLSGVACRTEVSRGRGILPLRTYIEETLRRSRTSYSTLQVALYYLILIKPEIPKSDFTQEQGMDCAATRSLMCGRRMFLSALILASKYLQDRNYSAKAWSKMSGLKVSEINTNERTFLSKVSWKLHIPELIFKRWTDVVLKYTPQPQPPSPDHSCALTWKAIIPLLTPELDKVPMPQMLQPTPKTERPVNYDFMSPTTPTPTKSALNPVHIDSTSQESTPTPLTVLPRFLEPKPDLQPPTPALARMGPLPTPQLTPSSIASSTPAVSVCGSRRPSMSSAMRTAQCSGFKRSAMDTFPGMQPSSRRPSISTASSRSSPESMISDLTRSSRASSISSISTVSTTSSMAPSARACLARQATCRNVRLPLPALVKEEQMEGSEAKPIIINDDTEMLCASPEFADFTVSDKALHAPHRHSKHAPHHQHQPLTSAQHSVQRSSRKRVRPSGPRGGRRIGLQEEVRVMLEEELDDPYDESMDIDEDSDAASATPAVEYARGMLSRSNRVMCCTKKELQPPPTLLRRGSRLPFQKMGGNSLKRACCMDDPPSPRADGLHDEVV